VSTLDREPVLEVQDLHRVFGGVRAVDGVSFQVLRGSITGLIGPNGAGKSTVLNMLAGAQAPDAGSIKFEGRELAGRPAYRIARRGIGRTFQLSGEFSQLTVLENLLVGTPNQKGESLLGALLGKWYWRRAELAAIARARALMQRFDMTDKEDELGGNLSGGQKRLLEIMRALMASPRLLLLDEPMAGVSPALALRIEEYLLQLRHEGLTMLMVEHELGVVERMCDTVVVMARGKVISQGTMSDVLSSREVTDAYLRG
jgi:neutral amino acid transport system ATP-binding protein